MCKEDNRFPLLEPVMVYFTWKCFIQSVWPLQPQLYTGLQKSTHAQWMSGQFDINFFCIVIHQVLDRASHLSKGSSMDRFPGYWSACQSILKQDVRVCNWYKILGIENTAYMNLRDWVNEPCKEKRFECSEEKSLYFVWHISCMAAFWPSHVTCRLDRRIDRHHFA